MRTETGRKIPVEIRSPETEIHNIIAEWGNETFFKGDDIDKDNLLESVSWLYSSGHGKKPQILILDSPLECQLELNRMQKKGLHKLFAYQADLTMFLL